MSHPTLRLRPGFTLLETLLAMSIFSMLASALMTVMVTQLRISRKSQERVALEHSHLFLQETLRRDMVETTAFTHSLRTGGEALGLQFVAGVTPEGSILYDQARLVVYQYLIGPKRLERRLWSHHPPVTLNHPPQRLTPADWAQIDNHPQVHSRTVWSHLEQFQFRNEVAGTPGARLWVDCTWKDSHRNWATSYCLSPRQAP